MDLKSLKNYGSTLLKDCGDLYENLNKKDDKRTEKVQSVALRVLSTLAVVQVVVCIALTVATCASPVLPSVISLLALGSLGVVARDMFVIGHNALHNNGTFTRVSNSLQDKEPLFENTWVVGPFFDQGYKLFMKFS